MPFQTITDEETGEERKVYVLPEKETPLKIEDNKESSDMTGGFVGVENTGIVKGFESALENEGPLGWMTRAGSQAVRTTLQEGNDRIIDELRGKHDPTEYENILGYKKLGLDKAPWWAHGETTSVDKPDHNFLFFDKPIPEVPTTGHGEHMAGDLLAFIGMTIGVRKGGAKISRGIQNKIRPRPTSAASFDEYLTASEKLKKYQKVGNIINYPKNLAANMKRKNIRGWRVVKGAYEGAVPSAVAGNILQEPHEGNLANTLDEMGVPGANLLAVNPTDPASIARLKNDIVNFVFDPFPGIGFEYGGALGRLGRIGIKKGGRSVAREFNNVYKERLAELLTRTRQIDLLKKAKALKEKAKSLKETVKNSDPATSSKEVVEVKTLPTKSITGRNGTNTSPYPLREQTEDPLWASGYEEQQRIDYDQEIKVAEKQQEEAYQDLSRSQVIENETITSDQSQDLSNKGVVPAVQKATPDQVTELSTKEISVNSDVFQVKAAGKLKKSGVSGSLKDIENYQEFLSGIISVWRDVNGEIGPANKVYVVNGHNRLDAAKRFGREKMVVRYLDAATAKEASNQGALQNMAESKLAAVDAARFIRNTGSTPQDLASQGIVLTDNTVNKAIAFSRLPGNLFTKLMEGTLSEAKAKALGSLDISPDIINDVAVTAGKGKWSAEKIEQAIQMAANASVKEEAGVIPGLGNFFKSTNAKQILDVRTEIVKLLNQEIIALRPASSEATANILEGAGNKITVEGSQSRRELATQSLAAFNKLAGQSGPLTDLITDLVGLVKGKNTAKKVVTENYPQIKETLEFARTGQPTLKMAPAAKTFADFRKDPEYQSFFEEGKEISMTLNNPQGLKGLADGGIQDLIKRIDNQMDAIDDKIFNLEEGDRTELYLEQIYKSFDNYRIAAKNELKARTNPITTNPQEIQKKPLDTQKGNLEKQEIQNQINELEIEWAVLQRDLKKEFPDVGDYQGTKPNSLPPERREIYLGMINRHFELRNQIKELEDLRKTLRPGGKLTQALGNTLKTLAQSDARIARAFELPNELKRMKPAYGGAALTFESELDQVAYIIRNKKQKSAGEDRIIAELKKQGYSPDEIKAHGTVVHAKLKQLVKDQTGSASASPDNTAGLDVTIPDQNFKGVDADYMADGPALFGIGDEYINRRPNLTPEQIDELRRIVKLFGGGEVRIEIVESLDDIVSASKAAKDPSYAGKIGQKVSLSGSFRRMDLSDPTQDIVTLAMTSGGKPRSFSQMKLTAIHEATHRMYRRFLKESEYLLFKKGEKQIREIAGKAAPWLDSTKIPLTEAVSYASMVWDNVRADYVTDKKVPDWARPLEKLKDLIFEVKKYFGGQRYKTWDELFDAQTEIVKGEYASPYRGVDDIGTEEVFGVPKGRRKQKSMTDYEVDPEDIVDGARRQREFIENGGSIEDAMKSNYRRFISRTGKTDYISRESVELISMNKNLEESMKALLGERANVTNMPDYTVAELMDIASREFINNGANPETTFNNILRARKGDIESQDELYATAGLLFHREWNLEQLNVANTDYLRAGTPEVETKAAERLLARWEDQFKLDTAWTKVTRNAGQLLRLGQVTHEDAIYPAMSRGVQIKFSTTDKAATSSIENGLTPQKGAVGEAAYFSTETTPGETEVFGGIPEDVRILDLVERNKDMLKFIQDIGFGKTKKTKDGFQISPEQQQGVQDYLAERGYSGIRYGTDFIDSPAAGDQIAIFDIDSANKAIGSNAAPAPERISETSTRQIIEGSLQDKEVGSSFGSKIPKRVIDKIKAGKIDQEARELLDMLSVISYEYASNPKSRKPASDLLEGIPKGQLKKNVMQSLYRNMIFFSMRTWMKVFAGSGYRALTLPINQILGEGMQQRNPLAPMNPEQTRLSQRRQMLNVKLYQQYGQNLPYAVRMMVTSMRQNEVLVNLGRGYTEEAGRLKQAGVVDQLELEGMKSRLREQTDGTEWHLDGNKNPLALAMKYTGAATTVPGRIMGGLDTFWAAMVGPSTEWARLMDQELFSADQKGFEIGSEAAWDWAESRVDTMLKAHFQDIDLANGEVIRNGRLKGAHAKKAMDWVNFTDDIEAKPETRTFQYGVRKAQEEGLVDSSDIVKRANRWVQESPEPSQVMKNMHKITNLPGKAGEAVSNIPFVGYILHPINRTPTNLVKSAMRMTPGANMLVDSYWRDINSEDHFTRSRAIGEVATGWMTLSMGVMMQKSGYMEFTGPGMTLDPLEEKERRERDWQPWSVRFKIPFTNTWSSYYDITMFDQLANVFASIAVFTENAARLDEDQRENVYGMAAILIAKQARDMGIGQFTKVGLGGMSDLMDVISEIADGDARTKRGARAIGERYVTSRLAGFYPQFMNTARIAADPYARRIDESDGAFGPVLNFLKTLALRTPGLSSTQPLVLHPTKGEPIFMNAVPGVSAFPKETPWLKMLYAWVSPLGATKERYKTTDIVDEEFLRLRGRGNTYNIWDRRMFNLKNRVLTSGEVEELITIGTKEVRIAKYGNVTMHEALRRLIQSSEYKKFESYDQEINQKTAPILINALINEYKMQAKEIFLSRNSEGTESIGYLYQKQQKENQAVSDLSRGVAPTIGEFEESINY